MSMDENLREECLRYFRERPVFGKLLRGFQEKYLSYGRFAGTVTLKNLKESDREDLEGFLLRNYHGKKSASVSAESFEKALEGSRFAGISGKDVLELYFRGSMEGKKEQRQREDRQWTALLDCVKKEAGSLAAQWLDEISEAQSGFLPYLKKRDREAGGNLIEAERLLTLGVRILDAFPSEKALEPSGMPARYLAVFAAEITGNPHAFDAGTKDGKYLEMLVEWYVRRTETEDGANGGSRGFPAFRKQRLYLKAGLLRDDVSNYALAAGIRARSRSGRIHAGMEGFLEEGEPVQIPLSAITGWKSASCPGMNGQPRFSSLLLLDLLAESGTEVWYAGDIDPEGLLIAQRLRRYYRGEFHYWHMSADDYGMCMSAEPVSQRRQKMLEKVEDPELKETAEALQKSGKAGYQENMLRVYLEIFRREEDKNTEESNHGE